jgi:hypothetical protein
MAMAFAVLLVAHGLIHLLGFAKAFGFAELPQLALVDETADAESRGLRRAAVPDA